VTAAEPDYTGFVEESLREAARLAVVMRGTGRAAVKGADVNQVVTDADLAVGALLRRRIARAHPRHGVLEEESGAAPGIGEVTWIVDPLDGTSNYAAGSPLYGVMMAAVDRRGVIAGGLALPAFGTVYVAQRGRGATRDGRPLGALPAIPADEALVAYGMDRGTPAAMAVEALSVAALGLVCRGVRMSNSVFDLCMVADGAYGAFVHRSCRIWDVAAAVCVLEACGGVCTDLGGRPLDLTDPFGRAGEVFEVCFAAPSVHPAVLAAVRQPAALAGEEARCP
jgi:myo-inositol-1(or 4)-monophosphatase